MSVNKMVKTFMYGLTIFVLIIIAGILSGIVLIPVSILSIVLASPLWVLYIIGLLTSIYALGFVFERFKVNLKRR